MTRYCWLILFHILLVQGSHILHRQKRVVKGVEVKLGEYPFQVSIQNVDSHWHHCGGIIVNETHILTAAHCLDGFCPEDFLIVAGTVDLMTRYIVRYVSEIYVHEDYDMNSWTNDIAIAKISEPLEFNHLIFPAKLPDEDAEIKVYSDVTVAGFGRDAEQSMMSKVLKKTEMTIYDIKFCNDQYKKTNIQFNLNQICAFDKGGKGVCRGDSGGPLIFKNEVHGIVSFNNKDCTSYPAVFTKISKYVAGTGNVIKSNFRRQVC